MDSSSAACVGVPPHPKKAVKVSVVDPLHSSAIEELDARFELRVNLRPTEQILRELLRDTEVLVMRSGIRLTRELLDCAKNLRIVVRAGVGVDNIDLEAARTANIIVFNVPGETTRSVAEFTIGLLFAIGRRIVEADRQIRQNLWRKEALVGTELKGKRIGIVGLGEIGREVARIAKGFGMEIGGCVAHPTALRRDNFAAEGIELMPLSRILSWSDVITIHVPLSSETRGLIGEKELATCKKEAYLINVSRGGVVNEQALFKALSDNWLAGAATDVHEAEGRSGPLREIQNVVLTPHIGAMTDEAQKRVALSVVRGIEAGLNGEAIANQIC